MIPTIREYMDEKLKDMRVGVHQIDGEYSDVLYWMKQYCEMVVDECVGTVYKGWPGMDIIRDAVDNVKEML